MRSMRGGENRLHDISEQSTEINVRGMDSTRSVVREKMGSMRSVGKGKKAS